MNEKKPIGLYAFSAFTFVIMLCALYMVFVYVPTEKVMGIVQRIFYFHVSLGVNTMVAFTIVFIYSILFLIKKEDKYDIIAHAAAEMGVVFCILVLITGPIWAKPIWGAWWTWEPRLTTTLILLFIYIAYLMLRATSTSRDQRAKFAAVYAIVGYVDVPIMYFSIHWWSSKMHPVVVKASGIAMAPEMKKTALVSLIAITCVFFALLRLRIRQGRLQEEIEWTRYHLSLIEEEK